MKIYILKINSCLRPDNQPFLYPKHNNDYGVEQDFYNFITSNNSLITDDPAEADWHYLPVYWTRWHLNHDYGMLGKDILTTEVSNSIIDDLKTFTICQYDDGPLIDLGRTTQFLSSRKVNHGLDIPLLCKKHKKPFFSKKKRNIASFVGRSSTHPIRIELFEKLKKHTNIFLYDGELSTRSYVSSICQSYLAIAPRGYGGNSFRMYEAMQLGVAPVLISDIDTRPFKSFLPWDDVSLYFDNVDKFIKYIHNANYDNYLSMGDKASHFYRQFLSYGVWCHFVIKELESIKEL